MRKGLHNKRLASVRAANGIRLKVKKGRQSRIRIIFGRKGRSEREMASRIMDIEKSLLECGRKGGMSKYDLDARNKESRLLNLRLWCVILSLRDYS